MPETDIRAYARSAWKYAEGVVAGHVVAGKLCRLACTRMLDDRETANLGYRFDETKAGKACAFIEHMPHVKGEWARRKELIHLEDWQRFLIANPFGWVDEGGLRRFRTVYDEVARKNSKAESVDNLIPTPSGICRMGDLGAGDYVFDEHGLPTRIKATTATTPDRPCMEVEFSTGERIVVAADHLWKVEKRRHLTTRRRGWSEHEHLVLADVFPDGGIAAAHRALPYRSRYALLKRAQELGIRNEKRVRLPGKRRPMGQPKEAQVLRTDEIASNLTCAAGKTYSVRLAGALTLPAKDLECEPYALGCWLGDGHSSSAYLTVGDTDLELVGHIVAAGERLIRKDFSNPGSTIFRFGRRDGVGDVFQTRLRAIGILENKHIPLDYLRASANQRLGLLQGLMDTDGTISVAGQCIFTNTRRDLIDGVFELIAGLGWKPSLREDRAVLNGKDCGPVWEVQFCAFADRPVFRLSRKLARQKPNPNRHTRSQTRQIVGVRPVPSVPVKCIEVENPSGLYLTSKSCIPTHNSSMSSGVANLMLALDGEMGAECYSAATTRDQARIVFRDAKAMAQRSPDFRREFGVSVHAHRLVQLETGSFLEALSAEGSSLDGLNPHLAVIDELHAHKTRAVYDVIETAMGARSQPLLWLITTAGGDLSGICYEVRSYLIKVLEQVVRDETFFGVIYTIDEEDSWDDPAVWPKANPNLGISVKLDDMQRLAAKARVTPAAQNNFKTKRLNVWVQAMSQWMPMEKWHACADASLNIDDYEGRSCYIGLDLATKIDIVAALRLFPPREDGGKYALFGRYYIPEDTLQESANASYQGWASEGRLTVTEGDVVDFSRLKEDLIEDGSTFAVEEIAYDPWQATQLAQDLQADGATVVEYRQTVQNFSEPMKEFEALVRQGRVVHDGDPVLTWMVSNVVCKFDAKDNVYPRKERPENKIDGVVAGIMALGRHLVGERDGPSVYEDPNFFM